ncbi:MAG: AsmA family protein [Alphaproteobacteria bacterium]|nr:AsmA family protein [Alphaproteobacteria bacterium]
MRRIALISAAVIVALIGIALIVPYFIPASAYKGRIEAAAKAVTGRQLVIAGPVRFSVFPVLGIAAENVRLINAPGAPGGRDFVSMQDLAAGVRLWPLLSGKVEITAITFDRPIIHLAVDAKGQANWTMPAGSASSPSTTFNGKGGSLTPQFSGISISNGTVIYDDAETNVHRRLSHIELNIALTRLDAPIRVSGSFTAKGQKIGLDGRMSSLVALRSGAPTEADLSITSPLIEAGFKGTLARNASSGEIKLVTPNVAQLLAWAGKPLAAAAHLGHLSLQAQLSAKGSRESLRALKLVTGSMTIAGDLTYDGTGTVPKISGNLNADNLDLNTFMTSPAAGAASPAGAKTAQSAGWSRTPLNLSLLEAADADLTLSAQHVELRNLKLGTTRMQVRLNGGKLVATLNPVSLYGGSGQLQLAISQDHGAASLASNFALANVEARPLLHDALAVDHIEGIADLSYSVTARGQSPDAIMHALAGNGRIEFRNGRIRGVNLLRVAQELSTVLGRTGISAGSQQSTQFSTMGGSFVIANGIMTNHDFHLESPLLRMTGAGTIDLGDQTLDFVVKPLALTSLSRSGVGVPFRIHGPWTHLTYTPDLSGVAGSILNSVAHGGVSTKSVLQGLMGANQGGNKSPPTQKKVKPLQLLQGLFGGH